MAKGIHNPTTAHRARVLLLPSMQESRSQVARIGPTPPALEWLANKASFRPVRLEKVRGKAANILKQELLAVGGDCVVSPQVADFDDSPGPIVLLGTMRQYERLVAKLQNQPLGLPQIAQELRVALDHYEQSQRPALQCPHGEISIGQRTLIMGIINMTPDSFAGDGLSGSAQAALQQAEEFAAVGADIIDIGGESTRPGTSTITAEEELQRVLPALRAVREAIGLPVSIDTSRAQVARQALAEGADIINDVYALRGEGMLAVAGEAAVPVVIMHMQGTPKDMQQNPTYEDLITEIYDFFAGRIEAAMDAGVAEQQIIIDPGFGFGKAVNHNLEIVRRLREFRSLGRPILVGPSRKSTIGKVLDRPVDQRLWGTAATCAAAIINGADIIRVHDVAQMTEVARMTDAIVRGWGEDASN